MKRLLLVRHAKSDWSQPDLPDHERPLNKRGLRDAPLMAKVWTQHVARPDVILSSTALRALQTAREFAKAWGVEESAIVLEPRLYLAGRRTLLDIVQNLSDKAQLAAMFGHNEGLSEFFCWLVDREGEIMPTCAGALIRFEVDSWKDVSPGIGLLERYDYPKKYY
ncbi:MAG: histidine phosphatase family protein [Flavobacteriales bacterium]|nr:histidine phosphatase family protein [Flavobacteriales bacterium]MCX7768667.1 histidine phosphatase family protein [Flavobacteriales bacterium]MDW8410680.1 histidine phosphatase family protein [Flavobacteriales bacterium]